MATKTVDVLQDQIQKLEQEASNIQNEVSSQKLQFTVLNTRLDDITLTITQLKGFQSQLNGSRPQTSGMRGLFNLGTAGAGSNQVSSQLVTHFSPCQLTDVNLRIQLLETIRQLETMLPPSDTQLATLHLIPPMPAAILPLPIATATNSRIS